MIKLFLWLLRFSWFILFLNWFIYWHYLMLLRWVIWLRLFRWLWWGLFWLNWRFYWLLLYIIHCSSKLYMFSWLRFFFLSWCLCKLNRRVKLHSFKYLNYLFIFLFNLNIFMIYVLSFHFFSRRIFNLNIFHHFWIIKNISINL